MSNTEKSVFWICVILTMAIAIVALVISLSKLPERVAHYNYNDALATIFSTIITVLLGWQIYSVIDISNTVKQVDALKNKLVKQSELLETQDKRNLCLIEAFQHRADVYNVEKSRRLINRYHSALKAIRQFLRAGAPHYYIPFWNLVNDLPVYLNDIRHASPRLRKLFNDRSTELEELYDEIISEIDIRSEEMAEIKKLIKEAHRMRLEIHNAPLPNGTDR